MGNVSADVVYNNASEDGLWGTPENWANGEIPNIDIGYVRIFMDPSSTIVPNDAFVISGIHLGNDNGAQAGQFTMVGGTLTVETINCGYKGTGTIDMIDGTIILSGTLKIARETTAIGHINLDGGTIATNNFLMREKEDAVGTMDVGGGMLTIDGDETSLVQGYTDNDWITAYKGKGTLQWDYNVTNPGLTTLTAATCLILLRPTVLS